MSRFQSCLYPVSVTEVNSFWVPVAAVISSAEPVQRSSMNASLAPLRDAAREAARAVTVPPTQQRQSHLWALGIFLELLGTLFNVGGKQCIRYAQITGKMQFWLIGVVLWSVVYPVFDISALNFAPESTVFSVDGMIVVWNIILAPYTLGEPITRSKLTSALVVTVGTIGAGAFGSRADSATTSAEYMALLCSASSMFYYLLFFLVVGGCIVLLRRHDARSRVGGLLLGVLAGWFGGCAFFLKVLIQFVREDAWESGWLYFFGILTVAYMAFAVYCVSAALGRHEAVYIIPIYEGVLIVNGAVNGYLVLRDYEGDEAWRGVIYWLSVSTILLGLYLIVWWPRQRLGDGEERVLWLDFLVGPPGEPLQANAPGSAGAKLDEHSSLVPGAAGEREPRGHNLGALYWPLERLGLAVKRARHNGACVCTCVCPCFDPT